MRTWVGTSGWIYPHWRERFYPKGCPARAWLRYAAERFDALEVNATFYGSARPSTFARWYDEVAGLVGRARGFRFAIKGTKYLTHLLRLKEPAAPLANFFAQGPLLLGATLGPILWQLHPQAVFDADRLERFLELLPRDVATAQRLAARHDARFAGRATTERGPGLRPSDPIHHVIEPRHRTFADDAFYRLCERYHVGIVVADTAGVHLELDRVAGAVAYARLHGSAKLYASRYEDDELRAWARRIERWRADGAREVYVFFDNDGRAHAPYDAIRLRRELGLPELAPVVGAIGPSPVPLGARPA